MNKKWMAIAVFLSLAAGCKQGRGERCEDDSDCAAPLLCSKAPPKTCGGTEDIDNLDASLPDGPPKDAAVDAMIDAAPPPP